MANLAEIAEKIGELRGDVRASREDMREVRDELTGLSQRVGAVETQLSARKLRERLIWSAVTAAGVVAWGAIGLIPWRFWATLAKAIAAHP